ncbi:MAG: hypothetical protein FWF60_01765, partial [Oscillospiraceae bacterium]|nr:hypothetical protein [Oscillospiraceae bacterium]
LIGARARFYELALPLPGEDCALVLPQDARLALLSASVRGEAAAAPACALFDCVERKPDGAPYALTRRQERAKNSAMALRRLRMEWRNARAFMRVRMQVDFGG